MPMHPSPAPQPGAPPIKPEGSPFRRDLPRLFATEFDVLVIGGGSIGTAVARDAALRGLSVALIEREDFGAGTVARSTRLIHGGLRYLEMYDFRLVREALREREILLRTALHLVRPLPFVTPIYRGDRWSPLMVGAGMILYDLLSHPKSMPAHRMLNVSETLALEPGLRREGLLGGALYYDGQVPSPERWCLAQARSAAEAGALCANHLGVVRLREEGIRIAGAEVEDGLTGERCRIRARMTVNATGPWAAELSPSRNRQSQLRRTKGSHLVVPRRLTDHAIVLLAQRDGRVFFVVPWEGRTLIGTTDLDFTGDPADAKPTPEEIRYLIEETRRIFPRSDLSGIEVAFAGVRPLLPETGVGESQVSREHRIMDHASEGWRGLISVFGGKLTTARAIAEEVVDRLCDRFEVSAPCRTAELPLYGGDLPMSLPEWTRYIAEGCRSKGVRESAAAELVSAYGSKAGEVLALAGEGDFLLFPDDPVTNARMVYGLREEMALTSADLLMRRTLIAYGEENPLDLGVHVALWLGGALERSSKRVEADLIDYSRQLASIRFTSADVE